MSNGGLALKTRLAPNYRESMYCIIFSLHKLGIDKTTQTEWFCFANWLLKPPFLPFRLSLKFYLFWFSLYYEYNRFLGSSFVCTRHKSGLSLPRTLIYCLNVVDRNGHNGVIYFLDKHFLSQLLGPYPNWHEAGHFYPPCNFGIGFCQLNLYQKFPNFFGGENWHQSS